MNEIAEIYKRIYDDARRHGACDVLPAPSDAITLGVLAEALMSPQGVEFALKSHRPRLKDVAEFVPFCPERYGIYINAGKIVLWHSEGDIMLVGDTSAEVVLGPSQKGRTVTLLHGARATITAEAYCVVCVKCDSRSKFIGDAKENSLIL